MIIDFLTWINLQSLNIMIWMFDLYKDYWTSEDVVDYTELQRQKRIVVRHRRIRG